MTPLARQRTRALLADAFAGPRMLLLLAGALVLVLAAGAVLPDGWPSIVTLAMLFIGVALIPFDARLEYGSVSVVQAATGRWSGRFGPLPARTVWMARFLTLVMMTPIAVVLAAFPTAPAVDAGLWAVLMGAAGVVGIRSSLRRSPTAKQSAP